MIDKEDDFESPLKFPNPAEYVAVKGFRLEDFIDEYMSCLIELSIIVNRVYDPVLRKKLDSLMRGTEGWLNE